MENNIINKIKKWEKWIERKIGGQLEVEKRKKTHKTVKQKKKKTYIWSDRDREMVFSVYPVLWNCCCPPCCFPIRLAIAPSFNQPWTVAVYLNTQQPLGLTTSYIERESCARKTNERPQSNCSAEKTFLKNMNAETVCYHFGHENVQKQKN